MDVGNQIRYYRKRDNLSQAELAEKISIKSDDIELGE